MVRKSAMLVVIATCVIASSGYAQVPKKVELYLNGAVAFPFTPR